jgi:4-amino-4-deoxy-L-arabinose transferase-like glycosyltransferase
MRGHTRFWLWLIGFGMIGKLSHGSPLEEELARVPSWLGLTLLVASFFLLVWPGYRRRASFTLAFVAALFFLVVWPGPHRKG